ncbi:MAG: 4Fe-4S binding protein [Deltaproteobacteria bacterium]|nr:4Fe-4S binding protein [Deltaproteobacteria bacterium]
MAAARTAQLEEGRAAEPSGQAIRGGRWSLFPAWCKACGNCLAFCPRRALRADQWGRPCLPDPGRCTGCGLCEMLCPDFAITVGEAAPRREDTDAGSPGAWSPERLAQAAEGREES